ncbi:MAG: TRAM domain-containing protein [Nitrospirae bacterium]|nr:TRAM domain-containing protein [Candidatus Troglogloeales bacterium]
MSWKAIFLLFFSCLGIVLALKVEKDPRLLEWHSPHSISNSKILDTSVIIDGRIADLCETGFLEGTFIIPQFVLQELQYIADSGDSNKRVRGKRGLDILHRLQKMEHFDLRIVNDDFPSIREVDAKIVALARQISAKVVTNDMNLNRVAELQGVFVLNINQLTSALKPVVLPGETMRVFVLKEGKEAWQGVAYLDDGTMIVIDDARKSIGKKVDISVTSVLQTTAGRMIFAKMREESAEHNAPATVYPAPSRG